MSCGRRSSAVLHHLGIENRREFHRPSLSGLYTLSQGWYAFCSKGIYGLLISLLGRLKPPMWCLMLDHEPATLPFGALQDSVKQFHLAPPMATALEHRSTPRKTETAHQRLTKRASIDGRYVVPRHGSRPTKDAIAMSRCLTRFCRQTYIHPDAPSFSVVFSVSTICQLMRNFWHARLGLLVERSIRQTREHRHRRSRPCR